MRTVFGCFLRGQLDSNNDFLQNVVVVVVLGGFPFPLCELFLKFEVCSESFRLDLIETRQEVFTDVFVVVIEGF